MTHALPARPTDAVAPQDAPVQQPVCAATAPAVAESEVAFDDLWGESAAGTAALEAGPAEAGAGADIAASALLDSCAAEARRLATAMTGLDTDIAAALAAPGDARPQQTGAAAPPPAGAGAALPAALQRIDLLRQEVDGLARVIELLRAHGRCDGRVPFPSLAAATPLAAQRLRLQTVRTDLDGPASPG